MALELCMLASGSAGNCLWVRGGGTEILVDAGLPLRTVSERLESVGLDAQGVSAVLLTHGHADHVGCAAVYARRLGAALYGTPPTLRSIPWEPPENRLRPIVRRGSFTLGGLTIRTAPTPHDAAGSVSYVIDDGETSVGIVTDLGTHTRTLVEHLSGLDALVLETNHDVQRLLDGPYPEGLKRRIHSDAGHLSNEQAGRLLQRVVLSHLSEQNNEPALARAAIEPLLDGSGVALDVASQHAPGPVHRLRPVRRAQLALSFG